MYLDHNLNNDPKQDRDWAEIQQQIKAVHRMKVREEAGKMKEDLRVKLKFKVDLRKVFIQSERLFR